ncbi:MAG: enoyl-CoA hydratase-related protein, partial [Asticcacaulis sp.]
MDEIIATQSEGVLTLTLDRPRKKNALTRGMYTALSLALDAAALDDEVRCVLVTANGGDFCAGNDIFDFAQGVADYQSDTVGLDDLPVFRFLRSLTFFPKPLIAAVQGQAVGVGVTLLLHCDLVVAATDARLSLPFLKLGLVPEAGSSLLLPRRIGHARAFGWMALGERVGAEEAARLGLVNRVVGVDELRDTATGLAAEVARLSPSSLRH